MPNPLHKPWSQIIPLIPVAEHSVQVDAATWQPHLAGAGLHAQHTAIFGGHPDIRLTRSRLLTHAYPNHVQKCLEIFMWGWPTRSRGSHRSSYLRNIPAIASVAPMPLPWPTYYSRLHVLGGLGISTVTKLAYFFNHRFGGLPSVILDSRIIDILAAGRWHGLAMPGLSFSSAVHNYPAYLLLVSNIAGKLGCTPDQVEFFLFSWGDSY